LTLDRALDAFEPQIARLELRNSETNEILAHFGLDIRKLSSGGAIANRAMTLTSAKDQRHSKMKLQTEVSLVFLKAARPSGSEVS